jgi:hypothetical protein
LLVLESIIHRCIPDHDAEKVVLHRGLGKLDDGR